MTVYSSNTSLILTDLLTRGHNYSFAVAVTDSTGQHGPWSDQLIVTWDGEYFLFVCISFDCIKVPGVVFSINYQWLNKTAIIADWEVSNLNIHVHAIHFIYTIATSIITNPSSCALLHCYSQCQW